jgi:hypothetical protein
MILLSAISVATTLAVQTAAGLTGCEGGGVAVVERGA